MKRLLILFLFSTPAFAASFDCSKASTPIEKAICSSKRLSALDVELAGTYAAARKLSGDAVRESQRKWLSETRAECEDYEECLEQVYLTRIATLRLQYRSLFAKQKPPARILGRYSEMTENCKPVTDPNSEDDYECHGELENFVDIKRVRGNAMTVESELWFHEGHMCTLSDAPAEWVGGELRVSIVWSDEAECTLVLRFEGDEVEFYDPALRCKDHCGVRGNFDETFLTKKK